MDAAQSITVNDNNVDDADDLSLQAATTECLHHISTAEQVTTAVLQPREASQESLTP
jgi:hypothetical protein